MASRAVGATLALGAALAFAGAIAGGVAGGATPAWWDGHPTVDGKTFERMDAHVGALGATRCFDNDASTCSTLDTSVVTQIGGYAGLGVDGLALVLAVVLVVSGLRMGERRKGVAKVAAGAAVAAAAVAGALVAIGPDVRADDRGRTLHVEVPIGLGLYFAWGGAAALVLGAIATARSRIEPLRLKTGRAMPAEPAAFDVRQLLREQDQLRPAALGPEPQLGGAPGPALSTTIGHHGGAPLVPAAPQLRALYEVSGGGPPVVAAPPLPLRPPTPIPRASVGAIAGIPTPASVSIVEPGALAERPPAPRSGSDRDRPESQPIEPPPVGGPWKPLRVPTLPDAQLRAKTSPPPVVKLVTTAPPPRPAPAANLADRLSRPSRPPQTMPHAVPPPPETNPRGQRLLTDADDRLATAMRETEAITTVEVDAEAKAAAQAGAAREELGETGVGERTDQIDARAEPRAGAPTTEQAIAVADGEPPRPTDQVPITTAPSSLPPPKTAQVATSGPTPACPQCESPMAWVEEHLRFYCRQCRMYF